VNRVHCHQSNRGTATGWGGEVRFEAPGVLKVTLFLNTYVAPVYVCYDGFFCTNRFSFSVWKFCCSSSSTLDRKPFLFFSLCRCVCSLEGILSVFDSCVHSALIWQSVPLPPPYLMLNHSTSFHNKCFVTPYNVKTKRKKCQTNKLKNKMIKWNQMMKLKKRIFVE